VLKRFREFVHFGGPTLDCGYCDGRRNRLPHLAGSIVCEVGGAGGFACLRKPISIAHPKSRKRLSTPRPITNNRAFLAVVKYFSLFRMLCAECERLAALCEILDQQRAEFAAEYAAALGSKNQNEIRQLKEAVREAERFLKLCRERLAAHAATHP